MTASADPSLENIILQVGNCVGVVWLIPMRQLNLFDAQEELPRFHIWTGSGAIRNTDDWWLELLRGPRSLWWDGEEESDPEVRSQLGRAQDVLALW